MPTLSHRNAMQLIPPVAQYQGKKIQGNFRNGSECFCLLMLHQCHNYNILKPWSLSQYNYPCVIM